MDPISYPIRINRYLALKGIATRRGADDLIEKGRITINGRPANLGDQVNLGDVVDVNQRKGAEKEYVYIAYHKPRGTLSVPIAALSAGAALGLPTGVFPIGRLDKDSSGLLILTDDGRITDRLLNPEYDHEKEYDVMVDKPFPDRMLHLFSQGVDIEGYRTKPAAVKRLSQNRFSITLTEGKKHQIRRMCAALGYQVRKLKRIRVMNIPLGRLKEGEWRPIKAAELKILLSTLGL